MRRFQPGDGCVLMSGVWLVVIWRKRRLEPEREYETISQHGQHTALYVLRSKRAAKEFLDGLDIENTKAHDG